MSQPKNPAAPSGWRLLEDGEIVNLGDSYTFAPKNNCPVNWFNEPWRWNKIYFDGCISAGKPKPKGCFVARNIPLLENNPAAVALGRLGGKAKSPAKTAACRANAAKPRPNARKLRAQSAQPKL